MKRILVLLMAVACADPKASPAPSAQPSHARDHQSAAPAPPPPTTTPRPPPPPPPPPARLEPQPPPDSVTGFLVAHAVDNSAWEAFVYEVVSTRGGKGPTFLGHSIVKRQVATAADAIELAERLGRDASYVNGDYGCVGDPVGFRLARGPAKLDFIVDCGHVSFGNDEGHAAMLSHDMMSFLKRLRAAR